MNGYFRLKMSCGVTTQTAPTEAPNQCAGDRHWGWCQQCRRNSTWGNIARIQSVEWNGEQVKTP